MPASMDEYDVVVVEYDVDGFFCFSAIAIVCRRNASNNDWTFNDIEVCGTKKTIFVQHTQTSSSSHIQTRRRWRRAMALVSQEKKLEVEKKMQETLNK